MNTIMRWLVLLGWYCREDYDNKLVKLPQKWVSKTTKIEWRRK